jgi:hypothetical protein
VAHATVRADGMFRVALTDFAADPVASRRPLDASFGFRVDRSEQPFHCDLTTDGGSLGLLPVMPSYGTVVFRARRR